MAKMEIVDAKKIQEEYKDKHKGKNFLLIGCGHSAAQMIPHKNIAHEHFDVIIGANKAFVEFDDIMDYHLVAERISKYNADIFSKLLNDGNFNTSMPRFINWKGLQFFDVDKYNIIPINRTKSNHGDLRSYGSIEEEGKSACGFFIGPIGTDNFSLGTVMLQAINMACIMGAENIHMIGADMVFKDNKDHFYGERTYRDKKIGKKQNQHTIINVGQLETTRYFFESAKFIDEVIETMCEPIGVKVFDMSDGLITKATKIDVNKLFSKE